MIRLLPALLLAMACSGRSAAPAPAPAAEPPGLDYPDSPRGDVVDDHFGTAVADPYRWLEDLDSERTTAWVQAQSTFTRGLLDALPQRDVLVERLSALWRYERWAQPVHREGRYFQSYNDGTMDQPALYVLDGLDAEPRMLLDANTLSEDGTVSVAGWVPSDDGTLLAYGLAEAGSDWRTWRVRDVATGEDTGDEVRWVKFSNTSWAPDGSGFFYSRFPEPGASFEETLSNQTVWFHRLGTPQSDDLQILAVPEHPSWGFGAEVTDDGEHLVVTVTEGTDERTRVWMFDLDDLDLAGDGPAPELEPTKVLDAFDAAYGFLHVEDDTAWFLTDHDAPRYRVIAVDLDQPAPEHWTEILPEHPTDTLRGASWVGGHLVARYLHDAASAVRIHTPEGALVREVDLPGLGTVRGFDGGPDRTETFFSFTGFTDPGSVYRYDVATGERSVFRRPDLAFDPDDFVTEQVRAPSKDGTEVPMFVVRHRDTSLDTPQPTLLYGYGGFNIPITPRFRTGVLGWLEQGGVYVSANLRGGGEFGRAWHMAGTKTDKQNVFDDFIASAEHLVAQGWTTPEQLAIHGRSNGGLLVGATMVQRPDLFGAAIPSVGVLDMLRYHKFTIGWAWAPDYGTAEDSPEMFQALYAYSPVHNTTPGTAYPPTLITTADHDDRVVPSHSFKFAAALQHAHTGPDPVLIRIETRAGHGAGTPVSMLVEEEADKLAFLAEHLGLEITDADDDE